ncbi:MAG: SdrD B-like domain-containing protein [Isosphaeraceae bacterium]
MTAPAGDPSAADAQNGVGALLNNNDFAMVAVDVDGDPSTFDSSSATFSLPHGSQVLFAGLYWGATSGSAQRTDVKIKGPGNGSYTLLNGSLIGADASDHYQAFADVTTLVRASGAGNYTVADIQADTGMGRHGGWGLVIAYRDPLASPRNLTVFDGLALVNNADPNVSFGINGFQTPPNGSVNARVGVIAYEGDLGLTGDSLSLEGQVLSDPLNPAGNFFDSTISRNGTHLTSRTPNYLNQLGFDADILNVTGVIANNATAATIALTTGGETYLPGVVTTAIDLYAPVIEVPKIVENLTHPGGPNRPGDVLEYTLIVQNQGGEPAQSLVVSDVIPAGTTYVSGSLEATFGMGTLGARTDALGDDTAEFDTLNNRVVFRVGTGATDTTGGSLDLGESSTIRFRVQVDPGLPSDTVVVNQADVSFLGFLTGTGMTTSSTSHSLIIREETDLSLTVTSDQARPLPGDTINLTITLENHGPSDAPGVVVNDVLPAGLTFVSASPGGGSYDPLTGVWNAGTLNAGDSTTLVIQATVNSSSFVATAAVCGCGVHDPDPTNDQGRLAANPLEADLDLSITVDNPAPELGDTVTFTLTVENFSPNDATGVSILDPIPDGLDLVSLTPSLGTFDASTGEWTVGTIPAGDSVSLVIVARVVQPETVRMAAVLWGADQPDPTPENDRAVTSIITERSDLAVVLNVDDPTPELGDLVNLTYTVTNSGPFPASSAQLLTSLPVGLVFVHANAAQGAYDSATGTWSIGSLDTADSRTLTITALVASSDPATVVATVSNPDQIEPDGTDNTASVSVIPRRSDVVLSASVDVPSPNLGDSVTFTISLTNDGPDSTNVAIQINLPPGLSFVSATPGQGSYDPLTGLWSAGLLNASTGATIAVQAVVTAASPSSLSAWVTQTDHADPDPTNNSVSVQVVPQVANLGIALSVDNPTPNVDDPITFTIDLGNAGPDLATNVAVAVPLPAGLTFQAANPGQGSYDPLTGIWSVGALASGGSTTLLLTADIQSPVPGLVTAAISHSDQHDGATSDDTASATVTPQSADLSLTLMVDQPSSTVGTTLTFTLTIANGGPDTATGIQVSIPIPPGLSLVASNPAQGTYDMATGTWTVGALANGASAGLVIQATVNSPDPWTLAAAITHAAQYDDTTDNTIVSVSQVPQNADLGLGLVSSSTTPNVGDLVTLTLSLSNAGPDTATALSVLTSLPAGLTFQAASASQGTYDPVTSTWDLSTLLSPDTATLSIEARVDAPTAAQVLASVTTSGQYDPTTGDHSAAVTITPQQSDLALSLSVDSSHPDVGDSVIVTVTLTNLGPDAASALSILTNLPGGLSLVSSLPAQGSYDPATGIWSVGSLPGLASTTLNLTATVIDPGSMATTASIAHSDQYDDDSANNVANVNIVPRQADLSVTIAVDDDAPAVGDVVTLTLTVTNGGPDLSEAVALINLLPAGVTWLSSNPTDGSFDPATGTWLVGDLAPLASASLSLTARIDTAMAKVDSVSLNPTVVHDPDSSDDTATIVITPERADVVLTQSVDDSSPNVGDLLTFTIVVKNHGPDDAANVVVHDKLPDGLEYVSSSANGGGTYEPVTGLWPIGSLPNGGSVTLQVTARLVQPGAGQNVASLLGDDATGVDPDSDNNQADAGFTPQQADLVVEATVDHELAGPGDVVTYTVTVTDLPTGDAATNVVIHVPIPEGTVLSGAGPSQGNYDPTTGLWSLGTLAPGESATLSLVARVIRSAGPFQASVARADQYDPSEPNNATGVAELTLLQSKLSGHVYVDLDRDGRFDSFEYGMANISVSLTGTDDLGQPVSRTVLTQRDGHFEFLGLRPGTYVLDSEAPRWFRKATAHAGGAGGSNQTNGSLQLQLDYGDADGYELGMIPAPGCRLVPLAARIQSVLRDALSRRVVNATRFDRYHPAAGAALAQGLLPPRVSRQVSGPVLAYYIPDLRRIPANLRDATARRRLSRGRDR